MINILDRNMIFGILGNLKPDAKPVFGKMTPQHMIEHLSLALSFSNGKFPQSLLVEERVAKAIRYYTIHTDKEMSVGFKAPMLGDDLLTLTHNDLENAIARLKNDLDLFDQYFRDNPGSTPICPVIGELNHEEWVIFHNKHFLHHFKQFGLI